MTTPAKEDTKQLPKKSKNTKTKKVSFARKVWGATKTVVKFAATTVASFASTQFNNIEKAFEKNAVNGFKNIAGAGITALTGGSAGLVAAITLINPALLAVSGPLLFAVGAAGGLSYGTKNGAEIFDLLKDGIEEAYRLGKISAKEAAKLTIEATKLAKKVGQKGYNEGIKLGIQLLKKLQTNKSKENQPVNEQADNKKPKLLAIEWKKPSNPSELRVSQFGKKEAAKKVNNLLKLLEAKKLDTNTAKKELNKEMEKRNLNNMDSITNGLNDIEGTEFKTNLRKSNKV